MLCAIFYPVGGWRWGHPLVVRTTDGHYISILDDWRTLLSKPLRRYPFINLFESNRWLTFPSSVFKLYPLNDWYGSESELESESESIFQSGVEVGVAKIISTPQPWLRARPKAERVHRQLYLHITIFFTLSGPARPTVRSSESYRYLRTAVFFVG